MNYVFDAGVLALLMIGDERLKQYVDEISKERSAAYVSTVNLGEFYYKTIEKLGLETAETWYFRVLNSDVNVLNVDAEMAKEAGRWKSKYMRILSFADCFALALAARSKSTLLTTDKDFQQVKEIKSEYFPV